MGGNAIIRFKKFWEGGNAMVDDIKADRVDFGKVERQQLIKQVVGNLKIANAEFEKEFGMKLWRKDSFISSGKVMSGSSKTFVDTRISDEEYKKHKPSMGDIDLQVDRNLRDMVSKFLTPGRKFGTMTYKGRVQSEFGHQIISLMHFPQWDIHIQMDWEFVDFTHLGMPTDWSSFAHSSAWEDMKIGVKGVFHKYIVGALDHGWTDKVMVLTPTGRPKKEMVTHPFAFSVDRGVRAKYREATEAEKAKHNLTGTVWVELKTNDSKYTTDLNQIIKMLIRRDPMPADKKKFNSFVGIVDIVKRLPNDKQAKVFEAYLGRLWDPSSQQLYRGDPKRDVEEKSASVNYFMKQIPSLKKYQGTIDKMIDDYYKNYRV